MPSLRKILADLVNTLQAPDDEALEVELVGDPKVEGPVQSVVLGEETDRAAAPPYKG